MIFRGLIFFIAVILLPLSLALAQEAGETGLGASDQQINDFSLTGYGDKGKKAWDLAGRTADIFDQVVKLKDVVGNMYGKEENVHLLADKGDFNKSDGKIHLQDNVVITTTSGMKLTTDSLDYDRKNASMATKDVVNIERENMTAVGRGASGQTNLGKVSLEKEVRLDILPQADPKDPGAPREKIVITCDGPLEVDYGKNVAYFNNNVKVERTDSVMYADKMDVYFKMAGKEEKAAQEKAAPKEAQAPKKNDDSSAFMGSSIEKMVARGNVKIVRGENTSYSDEAIYSSADKKITLNGSPRIVIYSTEEMSANAPFGG